MLLHKRLRFLIFFAWGISFAQQVGLESYFSNVSIKIDSTHFSAQQYLLPFQGEKHLWYPGSSNHEQVELIVQLNEEKHISNLQLMPSKDYVIIDSLYGVNEWVYKAKLLLTPSELHQTKAIIFSFKNAQGKYINYQLKLFPYKLPVLYYESDPIELFVDEEKSIEIPGENLDNIKMQLDAVNTTEDEVKIAPGNNGVWVKIKPKSTGTRTVELKFKSIRPFLHQGSFSPTYELQRVLIKIHVKPNRIDYLNPDKNTIYYNPDYKGTQEVQFDFSKNILLRKTYRIEDQAESGGNLIAEIYTQSQIGNNNKIITRLRTFALHKSQDGYLYIKDGDKTRFITNFDIVEKPRIDEIALFKDGFEDWTTKLTANPGDNIEIRIKGTGMLQSKFKFDGAELVKLDTTRLSDNVCFYTMRIPEIFRKRKSMYL